jgi:hypothetical protein
VRPLWRGAQKAEIERQVSFQRHLEGTRKSRAPSGVDRVSMGVSTSRKRSSSSRNRLPVMGFGGQASL